MGGGVHVAILLAATGVFGDGAVGADPTGVAPERGVTVELTCGAPVALGSRASAILAQQAQSLLQSSESNSQSAEWHFPVPEVQEEFRAAIASDRLVVSFATVRAIHSVGGPLRVRQIIVRLGAETLHHPFADRFVDSLFTVDDNGTVVGHALYSGERIMAIWREVNDATGGRAECASSKSALGVS